MPIIAGIPGGRQWIWRSNSYDPATRVLLTFSHFARYSGVNLGAVGSRPLDPSIGSPAGPGPPAGRAPPPSTVGKYTPEKSGGAAPVPTAADPVCARRTADDPSAAVNTATANVARVCLDMMMTLTGCSAGRRAP